MSDLEASVVIKAKDLSGPAMTALGTRLKGLSTNIQKIGRVTGLTHVATGIRNIGSHLVSVGRSLAPVLRGFTALTGIGAIASFGGLVAAIKTSATEIDNLAKAARQLDLPLQQLREFSHVADLQGVSWDAAQAALKRANKTYVELKAGLGRAGKQLDALNPALKAQITNAKDSATALDIMIEAVNRAGTAAEKAKLAELLFGSEDFTKIAELNANEFAKLMARARHLLGEVSDEQGAAVEKFNDSLTDLKASFKGLSETLTVEIAPQFSAAIDSMTEAVVRRRQPVVNAVKAIIQSLHDSEEAARRASKAFSEGRFVDWATEATTSAKELGATLKVLVGDLSNAISYSPADNKPLKWFRDLQDMLARVGAALDSFKAKMDSVLRGAWDKLPSFEAPSRENPRFQRGRNRSDLDGGSGDASLAGGASKDTLTDTKAERRTERVVTVQDELVRRTKELTDQFKALIKALGGEAPGGDGSGTAPHAGERTGVAAFQQAIADSPIARFASEGKGRVSPLNQNKSALAKHLMGRLMAEMGLSREQAAGVVGNLGAESALNPKAIGDGGTSFGLAQWHRGRWDALSRFANRQSKPMGDPDVQLDYLMHELRTTESKALRSLRQAQTAEQAAYAFMRDFERPSIPNMPGRVRWARQAMQAHSGPEPTGKREELLASDKYDLPRRRSGDPQETREPPYRGLPLRDRPAAPTPTKAQLEGSADIRVTINSKGEVMAIKSASTGHIQANVGVDRTGARIFRPGPSSRSGMTV